MRATRMCYYVILNHNGRNAWRHKVAIHEAQNCAAILNWGPVFRITQKQAQALLDKGWRLCKRCRGLK